MRRHPDFITSVIDKVDSFNDSQYTDQLMDYIGSEEFRAKILSQAELGLLTAGFELPDKLKELFESRVLKVVRSNEVVRDIYPGLIIKFNNRGICQCLLV